MMAFFGGGGGSDGKRGGGVEGVEEGRGERGRWGKDEES